jgi:hypothetical protein
MSFIGRSWFSIADDIEIIIITGSFKIASFFGTLLAQLFLELASSPQASFDPYHGGPF